MVKRDAMMFSLRTLTVDAACSAGSTEVAVVANGPTTRRKRWSVVGFAVVVLLLAGGLGWLLFTFRLRPVPGPRRAPLPAVTMESGEPVVAMPNGNLLADVGDYRDELTAYLRFEYLQSVADLGGAPVLLRLTEMGGEPLYTLYLALPNDVLAGSRRMARAQIDGFIPRFDLLSPPRGQIEQWAKQTEVFDAAYHQSVKRRLLQLPQDELRSSVAKFILFKSRTDRRVRERIEPASNQALSSSQSLEFAADMIEVATFYNIPLNLLLGVGAMENNYLDVRGDLEHTSWKRHPEPGDTVIRRRRGRVLVSNYSIGPWQITRETLRYAHNLYLHDTRDYSLLPPRLRPPKTLDLEHVDTHVLTTYAGLLLRDLLDYFHGDVEKAAGAYNGGTAHPNLGYAKGVDLVAQYAQRVLALAVREKADSIASTPLAVHSD